MNSFLSWVKRKFCSRSSAFRSVKFYYFPTGGHWNQRGGSGCHGGWDIYYLKRSGLGWELWLWKVLLNFVSCCGSLSPVPGPWLLVWGMEAKVEQDLYKSWSEKRGDHCKYRIEGSVSNWELPRRVDKVSSLRMGRSGSLGVTQKALGRRPGSIRNN